MEINISDHESVLKKFLEAVSELRPDANGTSFNEVAAKKVLDLAPVVNVRLSKALLGISKIIVYSNDVGITLDSEGWMVDAIARTQLAVERLSASLKQGKIACFEDGELMPTFISGLPYVKSGADDAFLNRFHSKAEDMITHHLINASEFAVHFSAVAETGECVDAEHEGAKIFIIDSLGLIQFAENMNHEVLGCLSKDAQELRWKYLEQVAS